MMLRLPTANYIYLYFFFHLYTFFYFITKLVIKIYDFGIIVFNLFNGLAVLLLKSMPYYEQDNQSTCDPCPHYFSQSFKPSVERVRGGLEI